jgi:NAD-dependent deacetylase
MREKLRAALQDLDPRRSIVFLTGAGISAESGIPTFRGEDGYWTVGSAVYRPQEMATLAFFEQHPWEVWRWYLYRRGVCEAARPNDAHRALVDLQRRHPRIFHLITQNIDGLHALSGSDPARTYEIHGSGHLMRCAAGCTTRRYPIPEGVRSKRSEDALTDAERALLRCPDCGGDARPHVLWFDEVYSEELYRASTAMAAAASASVFVTVGTSGATSLPIHAVIAAAQAGAVLIDINPEENPFQVFAQDQGGFWLKGSSSEWVPMLCELL